MSVIDFDDNFQRADGPLGVTSTGGKPWRVDSGSASISGGRAVTTGLATVDAEIADVDASLNIGHLGAFAYRVVDARNYWQIQLQITVGGTDSLYVQRMVNGALTTARQFTVTADGGRITPRVVTRRDGQMTLYVGTTQLMTTTNTTFATATRLGMNSPAGGSVPVDNLSVTVLSKPPTAPTGLSPNGTAVQNTSRPITLSWTPNNQGLTQTAFRLSYRLSGATAWQVIDQAGAATSYTFGPGGLPAGDYEWEVFTSTAAGSGPASARAFFPAATPPGTPVITSPSASSPVTGTSHLTTWTVDAQDAYQLLILADAGGIPGDVLFDSGRVASTARQRTTQHPVSGRTEWLYVRAESGGLWSGYGIYTYTVNYVTPPTPQHRLATNTVYDTLSVEPVVAAPGSGQPAVAYLDVYRRNVGSTDPVGQRVATRVNAGQLWLDPHLAHLQDVEYRLVAVGTNGTQANGLWTPLPPAAEETDLVDVTWGRGAVDDTWGTGPGVWGDEDMAALGYSTTYGTTY